MYSSLTKLIIFDSQQPSVCNLIIVSIYMLDIHVRNWQLIISSVEMVICISIVFRDDVVNGSHPNHLWFPHFKLSVNTLRPRQNGRHFADDTFKRIFLNENVKISIKNSLKFVPKGPFNNNSTLVQIMAWCRPGDKPLSEPMMVRSPTHIYVTRPQWVNSLYKWQWLVWVKNMFPYFYPHCHFVFTTSMSWNSSSEYVGHKLKSNVTNTDV